MAVPTEIHHSVPQCLLRLRDRADAASLDGEGIELALEFEHEAARYGVDPEFVSVYRPNSRSERPPHPLFRQFLYRVLRSSRLAPIAVIMLTVERLTRRFSLGGKKERATGALLGDLRTSRSRPASAPQQVPGLLRSVVFPTQEALAKLESEGKVRGAVTAGARTGAFILDADSRDDAIHRDQAH